MLIVWLVGPSPTTVAGLGPQPLMVNVAIGAPTRLMSRTMGCSTVVMVKSAVLRRGARKGRDRVGIAAARVRTAARTLPQ